MPNLVAPPVHHGSLEEQVLPTLELAKQSFRCRNLLVTVEYPPAEISTDKVAVGVEICTTRGDIIGTVRFTGVRDAVLPPLLEALAAQRSEQQEGAVSSEILKKYLTELDRGAERMSSHLGATIEQVVGSYDEMNGLAGIGKHAVPFYPFHVDPDKSSSDRTVPMRWVPLTAPTLRVLEQVADTLGVSRSTAEMYLHGDQPPAFFRSKEGCFYVFEELYFDEQKLALLNRDIFVIQNGDYLVTITRGQSDCIEQIRDEMRRGLLSDSEREYSNHLLVRLLGCTIHRNQKALSAFTERVARFAEQQEDEVPKPETRSALRSIHRSVDAAQRSITPTVQLLHALREEATRYGAKPKDALHRYGALLKISESQIGEARSHAKQVMDDWKLNQDNRRNDYQARWNILAAGLGPTALGLGVIEALGQSWSSTSQWGVVGVSVAISAALLVGMKISGSSFDRLFGSGRE